MTVRRRLLQVGHSLPWVLLAFLLLGLASGVRTQTSPEATVRKALEARYARYIQAVRQKDAASILESMMPQFTLKVTPDTPAQTFNHRQSAQNLKQYFGDIVSVGRHEMQIKRISVQGKQAVASVTEQIDMTLRDSRGEFGPKGKTHKLSETTTWRDTWQQTDAGWKIRSSIAQTSQRIVDGKPFKPFAKKK